MMTTTSRSKHSIDARAAATFVAFESLMNRTPPISPTGSRACASPSNARTARSIAAGETPAT